MENREVSIFNMTQKIAGCREDSNWTLDKSAFGKVREKEGQEKDGKEYTCKALELEIMVAT